MTQLSMLFINFRFIFLQSLVLLLCWSASSISAETLPVGSFEKEGLMNWDPVNFNDETSYDIVSANEQHFVRAISADSASGMLKKMHVDLTSTPYLNWSWKVDQSLVGLNERSRGGDDYAARVYVVIKDGMFFWQTKALIYVWSGSEKKDTLWPNAFTENSQMIALQSGDDKKGVWVHEKRNVLQDLKRAFGDRFASIDGVAFMTDTDNSDGQATAYYGDIFFTDK